MQLGNKPLAQGQRQLGHIPTLPPTGWVTLGRMFGLARQQFPHLTNCDEERLHAPKAPSTTAGKWLALNHGHYFYTPRNAGQEILGAIQLY